MRPFPSHFLQAAGYILRPGRDGCFTAGKPVPLQAWHFTSLTSVLRMRHSREAALQTWERRRPGRRIQLREPSTDLIDILLDPPNGPADIEPAAFSRLQLRQQVLTMRLQFNKRLAIA